MTQSPEVSRNQINLLSDTHKALRQLQMRQRLLQTAVVTVGITLLILGATFGYWAVLKRQNNLLKSQITVYEQQLAGFKNIKQLAWIYQQKLAQVKKLINSEETTQSAAFFYQTVTDIVQSLNSQIMEFAYDTSAGKIDATLQVGDIQSVHYLLEELKNREIQNLWSQVLINSLSQQAPDHYQISFTALINKL